MESNRKEITHTKVQLKLAIIINRKLYIPQNRIYYKMIFRYFLIDQNDNDQIARALNESPISVVV